MVDKKTLGQLSQNLISDPDDCINAFRKNLFMYIDRKDITLAELAEKADISMSTLRSFLYGTSSDCYVSMVVKLARVLNVSVDELLGAGTIHKETCESLQILRMLPERYTQYLRWLIHFHDNMRKKCVSTAHLVDVMEMECGDDGNIKMTNNMDIIDISYLSDDIRPKIFMGLKIPCNNYGPYYYEGDILLIANDREARANEHMVVNVKDNMWIIRQKEELIDNKKVMKYYSIRDGKVRDVAKENGFVLGYVVKTLRE